GRAGARGAGPRARPLRRDARPGARLRQPDAGRRGRLVTITVVIPALEEEATVGAAVRSVGEEAEVIVVDGGSRGGAAAAGAGAGARVVTAEAGRGPQLDRGARLARGDWLVFLHADTRLGAGWAKALDALQPDVVGGAFRFTLDSPRPVYRIIEAGVALR